MKFNVTSYWKLSEFALQRDVRDLLIEARALFGVTSLTIEYDPD